MGFAGSVLVPRGNVAQFVSGIIEQNKENSEDSKKEKELDDLQEVVDLNESLRATYKKKKAQLEDVLANGFKEAKYSEKFSELAEKYRIIEADERGNSEANLTFKRAAVKKNSNRNNALFTFSFEDKYVWEVDGEEKGTYKILDTYNPFQLKETKKEELTSEAKARLPIERKIQQGLRRRINFINGLLEYDRTYDEKQKEKKRDEEEERRYKQEIYQQREDDRRERERSRKRNVQDMQAFQNRFASQQQAFQNDYVNSQRAFQDSMNKRFDDFSSGLANQQRSFMEQQSDYFDNVTGAAKRVVQNAKILTKRKRKSTAPVAKVIIGDPGVEQLEGLLFQRKDRK